jgi:Family of unknown function (DUF5343)
MATAESAINGAQKTLPPYIAHKTFTNFINSLTQGIPSRIDKSIMRSLAGSTQGQLMGTLRYFDLIDADGTPQPSLTALVGSEGGERQRLIAEMVKRSYDFVFSSDLNLQTATTSQVEELFTAEGVTGETRRKSFSFFLALCKDGGIQLSSHIKPPKGVPGTRRRSARGGGASDPAPSETIVMNPPPAGTSKTIQLKSGGELSLSMNVNLFDLVGEERTFVFGLIDQIQAYQKGGEEEKE